MALRPSTARCAQSSVNTCAPRLRLAPSQSGAARASRPLCRTDTAPTGLVNSLGGSIGTLGYAARPDPPLRCRNMDAQQACAWFPPLVLAPCIALRVLHLALQRVGFGSFGFSVSARKDELSPRCAMIACVAVLNVRRCRFATLLCERFHRSQHASSLAPERSLIAGRTRGTEAAHDAVANRWTSGLLGQHGGYALRSIRQRGASFGPTAASVQELLYTCLWHGKGEPREHEEPVGRGAMQYRTQ